MLKNSAVALFVALVALCGITSPASAAGILIGQTPASLSNNWDMGDIRGGYQTSVYASIGGSGFQTSMNAWLGTTHKIDQVSVSFNPQYQYVWDNNGNMISRSLDGYSAYVSFYGRITSAPTATGDQSQSNQFNARGINLYENASTDIYPEWPDNVLFSNGNGSISIRNFNVTSANGWYEEYTYQTGGPGGVDPGETDFNYTVNWYGDFVAGSLTSGFVAPAMAMSVTPVPEPATMAFLAIGGLALVGRRLRRRTA